MHLLWAVLLLAAANVCRSGNENICSALSKLDGPNSEAAVEKQLDQVMSTGTNREDLTKELNERLQDRSNMPLWWSEIKLANNFRLSGTAKVLAESLNYDTRTGNRVGLYLRSSLENDPAALALVAFGEPAEAAVIKELSTGEVLGRSRSVYILKHMGDKRAEEALRQQYAVEVNPTIKGRIAQELGLPPVQ